MCPIGLHVKSECSAFELEFALNALVSQSEIIVSEGAQRPSFVRARLQSCRNEREIPRALAPEVMFSGGSPRIYAGEERFGAPEKAANYSCALALGTKAAFAPRPIIFGPTINATAHLNPAQSESEPAAQPAASLPAPHQHKCSHNNTGQPQESPAKPPVPKKPVSDTRIPCPNFES